ncbi:glycosyltransferase family 4 protein [Caldovatus aquaticus]|uniref:Glycosyltransferase family 4 protein n=1 Tax=Caldovatus aquaticus TaxID=2865671 RepID=A0ABS7F8X9_9PROT|nr:glycosyltransferase family 4 protein [Caldovatus aquaticus]MBW8271281.1 glycosyltransferase family 4 protein [Caldovatus aquaticus]
MPRPRVMLVGPWPPTTGGVTTFLLNVAHSPLRERFELLPFTTSRPPKRNVADNYGYRSVLRGGIGRVLAGAVVTLWHLLLFPWAVLRRRADIVQVQSSDFQSFWEAALYVAMARALRRPVLMRLGGAFDHFYAVSSPRARRLIGRVLRLPDRLIVQSAYWREVVRRAGRAEGVVVLPNWVPDCLAEPAARAPRAAPLCLFVAGTEAVRKGVEEVLAAMRAVSLAGCPLRFRLVALPPRLAARLEEEGIADLAEVEGYVGHARLLAIMREADIFLLPSRGEGFPNALIEAMASGMACIATPVGAIPEIAAPEGAILVPVRDAAALSEALLRLARDAALRRRLGENGRAIVRERYVASAVLPVLERAWLAVAGEAGRRPRPWARAASGSGSRLVP